MQACRGGDKRLLPEHGLADLNLTNALRGPRHASKMSRGKNAFWWLCATTPPLLLRPLLMTTDFLPIFVWSTISMLHVHNTHTCKRSGCYARAHSHRYMHSLCSTRSKYTTTTTCHTNKKILQAPSSKTLTLQKVNPPPFTAALSALPFLSCSHS